MTKTLNTTPAATVADEVAPVIPQLTKAQKAAAARSAAKANLKSSNSDPVLAALKASMNKEAKSVRTPTLSKAQKVRAIELEREVKARDAQAAVKAKAKTADNNAFAAMTASLTVDEAEAAETTAISAIAAARKSSSKGAAPSVRPADTARYVLGAYKGRAGAMYEFMKRAGALPEGFTREQMVDSCARKAPHAAVATRAQVLDYFAWAVRHGLLHVTEAAPVAAKVKAAKGRKAVSRLLQNPAA